MLEFTICSGAKKSLPIALLAFAFVSPKTHVMIGFLPSQSPSVYLQYHGRQLVNFFFGQP